MTESKTPRTDKRDFCFALAELPTWDQLRLRALKAEDELAAMTSALEAANECLLIANRSANDQMFQKREAEAALATAHERIAELVSLLNRAVHVEAMNESAACSPMRGIEGE